MLIGNDIEWLQAKTTKQRRKPNRNPAQTLSTTLYLNIGPRISWIEPSDDGRGQCVVVFIVFVLDYLRLRKSFFLVKVRGVALMRYSSGQQALHAGSWILAVEDSVVPFTCL